MISHTTADFRQDFAQLPLAIQKQAKVSYRLFQADPNHPRLRFKKLPPYDDIWSVRITNSHRAVGQRKKDVIVWFFIGSHGDYDKVLNRM